MANPTSLTRLIWKNRINYLFILPIVSGVLLFHLGPMIASLYYSLTKYDVVTPPQFIGLRNYVRLFSDPDWVRSLLNTLYYVSLGLPLRLAIALGAALLLNQKVRGIGVFRTIYYLPTVTAGVAISLLWRLIFEPTYGLANSVLALFAIRGPSWLGDPQWAMPSLIFMMSMNIGQAMLIFLGGLQTIPDQLYEAVELDGGRAWHKFTAVTFPHLTPVLFFNIVIGMISMMQVFTQVYVLAAGGSGPLDSLLVYVMYLYLNAFQNLRMGYGSAMAWVLFLILLVMTMIQFRLSGRWVYYKSGLDRR
jgi:multiple sugar transport system permease protein